AARTIILKVWRADAGTGVGVENLIGGAFQLFTDALAINELSCLFIADALCSIGCSATRTLASAGLGISGLKFSAGREVAWAGAGSIALVGIISVTALATTVPIWAKAGLAEASAGFLVEVLIACASSFPALTFA